MPPQAARSGRVLLDSEVLGERVGGPGGCGRRLLCEGSHPGGGPLLGCPPTLRHAPLKPGFFLVLGPNGAK